MRMKKFSPAAVIFVPLFLALPCHAELLPLWEVGAGLATLDVPDYRGSDVRTTYYLPIPYLVYRGEFLKADREGVRATLFESDRLKINLSLNATLPASSDDNPVRRGMPDLKPTVELGPTVDIALWNSAGGKMQLDLRAPIRAGLTLQSPPRHIGWLFAPNLKLNIRDPAGFAGWRLGMQTGPVFNSRRYNSYFYSVRSAEATASRPPYAASGGYSGAQATLTLSRRFPRYWVGAFVRYDNLAGAVFADSPVMQRRSAVAAGVAVAWVFGTSSTLVDVLE